MVSPPSKLLAVPALVAACALLAGVDATSIENNPITKTAAVVPMNDAHPAYGGPPRVVLPTIVPDNTDEDRAAGREITNTTAIEIVTASRMLEGAPSDMQKLETYFGKKLEVNYKTLINKYGKATPENIPWPAHYWPIYLDSINYKWKPDEASPSEKYAKAFGKNVKQFMDTVSASNGIDSFANNKKCSAQRDCDSLSDGSACAVRAGAKSGYCIPMWYGVCHAWAPASNWEPEPKCDVVKNGVTFHPYDLKGLVTMVYDGASINTVFTGSRFYGPDTPGQKDKYGRYQDAMRRDLGAGFFHLAISNVMGINGHSFVVDVTAGSEVWNQPIRSYEVIKSEIMQPAAAGKQYFGTNNYPFNDAAKFVAYTQTRFSYIIEAYEDGPLVPDKLGPYTTTVTYEYFVELDASYNIIGGEWLGDSRYEHPDFLWFATGTPNPNAVTDLGLSYKEIRALIDESVACKGSKTPEPTTPAPTTAKPDVTTPAPTTAKPDVTTPAPTTAKPDATTDAPITKDTPAPSSSTPAGKPTEAPPAGKPTQAPPAGKPTPAPPAGKPTTAPPAGKPTPPPGGKPEPTTASPSTGDKPDPTTAAPPAGKPTPPPGGKPEPTTASPVTGAPPAGKPTPPPGGKPEPTTASPSTGDKPDPTTAAPPAGKPTPPPGGKPEPTTASPVTGSPSSDKPILPGKVTPPGDDDDKVTLSPSSGAGKPTPEVTTVAPTNGKVTPPGGDDDDDSDDDVTPPSAVTKPTPAPTTGVTPGSGAGKPLPPAGNDVATPEPTKKKKKHKECHA